VPFVELPDVKVRYEVRGDAERTVVFSHGFLMDHSMFDAQVDALSGAFRCVTWDQRGHGETTATGPFTYWDSARDLIAVLDHLEVADAALVGMSQGGFLSLRAALTAPGRVRGLAFLDSQAGGEDPAVRPAYDALFAEWTRAGVSDDVAQVVATIILGDVEPSPWIAKWKARPEDQIRYIYETLVSREDLHDRLAEVTCPALVVHGTADAAIPMAKAEALCSGLARCRGVVPIEGGGHAVNLSHPPEVTDALRPFLDSLWP
jgi:3-oxoadipate enol-lactonase